ncbi:MAG: hypothetical protein A2152_00035 [Candidatus Levybacteria bacterium RBG_16_35_6]|nr:MAG: hypothetical protein A2152_00035 [Candidatus Levybacteria bacterium RBG_16_35_6]
MYSNLQFLLNPFFLLKVMILVMIFVFLVFMLIVLNQVRSMAKRVNQPKTPLIVTIGIVILLAAASLFLTSLVIL